MNGDLPPFPPSLWTETAPPAPRTAVLEGHVDCDVAVVGGGYAGLHAALTLAEAGRDVVVLEAGPPGYGGSGRNGGVVSAKFRQSFAGMARTHGPDMARRMYGIAKRSVDHLAGTLERHALRDTGYRRVGTLKCAHSPKAMEAAWAEAEWARRTLGETGLTRLSGRETEDETGSTGFVGGVLAEQGGVIQPLAYLRGLVGAALATGVRIYGHSPATALSEPNGRVLLQSTGGTVTAGSAILATDAYSGLTPATRALAGCIVPFRSAMIATERLPADLDRRLLAHGRSYTETRRMMRWFRKVDGRLLFGGRGALGPVDDPAAFRRLHRAMIGIFPDLREVPVTHRWSGLVALTFDALPQAGMLSPRIGYVVGFNGAGVAMAGMVGHGMARRLLGQPFDLGLIERARPDRVPFHAFRAVGVRAVTCGYEVMDAMGL